MSLTNEITPQKFQAAVHRGAEKLVNFRKSRIHFIRQYVGQWYDQVKGSVGQEPINLIFNAIRVLVPTMVFNFPKHSVSTPYLAQREYANLLALALDQQDMKLNVCDTYRRVIVDAIFTMGIMKTGLSQSDSIYTFDDDMGMDSLDNGTVYTEAVDFDDFVVDPNSKDYMFRDAAWMGDRITVPRQMLLDSGLYNNTLVEKLPRAGDFDDTKDRASGESQKAIKAGDNYDLQDEVEVYEIWVPSANSIVTVPASKDVKFDEYLRVDDYYGVKEGPYTLLCLTPPVPGNPLPVPMVGIWYDLHVLANRMATKIVAQADRQKTIIGYKRTGADDAQAVKDAGDGDAIAMDDPEAVKTYEFGGQVNSNEVHMNALEGWFNQMAGNPAQVGGQNVEAKSATAANLLQQNAGVGLEDMKDMVYRAAAAEARRRTFFLHADPFMQVPLIKRQPTPTPMQMNTPQGPTWMMIPTMQETQIILTPEARSGDFLDYTFKIEPESMGRVDSKTRLTQEMALAQQILPAVMAAAQASMAMGIPFNAVDFLIRIAKDMQITWLDEVLYDPNFQMRMMQQMMMGPQEQNSKGQPGQPNGGLAGQMQNGQPGQVMGAPQVGQSMPQQAQQGANAGQAAQFLDRQAFRTALRPQPNTFAGLGG